MALPYKLIIKKDDKEFTEDVTDRTLMFMRHVLLNRRQYGIKSRTEFAKIVGMNPPVLHNIENTRRHNFTVEQLVTICKVFSVNANWLFLGDGEMFEATSLNAKVTNLLERVDILEREMNAIKK